MERRAGRGQAGADVLHIKTTAAARSILAVRPEWLNPGNQPVLLVNTTE